MYSTDISQAYFKEFDEIDMSSVCKNLINAGSLPSWKDVRSKVRRGEIKTPKGVAAMAMMVIRATGEVVMLRIGSRGGMKVLHSFGKE